jgi:hypothetical protein
MRLKIADLKHLCSTQELIGYLKSLRIYCRTIMNSPAGIIDVGLQQTFEYRNGIANMCEEENHLFLCDAPVLFFLSNKDEVLHATLL